MKAIAPDLVVDVILYSLAVVVFLPVVFVIGKPLLSRLRGGNPAPSESATHRGGLEARPEGH